MALDIRDCPAEVQYPSDARYNAFACGTRAIWVRHACDLGACKITRRMLSIVGERELRWHSESSIYIF